MGFNSLSHLWVNSFHHQGILYTGTRKNPDTIDGVTVHGISFVGMTECKYIVEVMSGKKWISVQWHPEHDWQTNTASRAVLNKFKTMI